VRRANPRVVTLLFRGSPADDRVGFGNLDKYTGRQFCAHRVITEYRGKPEMVLHSPEALKAK
jgi:hypothetical protein